MLIMSGFSAFFWVFGYWVLICYLFWLAFNQEMARSPMLSRVLTPFFSRYEDRYFWYGLVVLARGSWRWVRGIWPAVPSWRSCRGEVTEATAVLATSTLADVARSEAVGSPSPGFVSVSVSAAVAAGGRDQEREVGRGSGGAKRTPPGQSIQA